MKSASLGFAALSLPARPPGIPAQSQAASQTVSSQSLYNAGFFLLQIDQTNSNGQIIDPNKVRAYLQAAQPDFIWVMGKNYAGRTTYPSKVGYTPPRLKQDMIGVYKSVAEELHIPWGIYFNLGIDAHLTSSNPRYNRININHQPVTGGGQAVLALNSGVEEKYLLPVIEEIMEIYKPDSFWMDGVTNWIHTDFWQPTKDRFKRETGLEAPTSKQDPAWALYKQVNRKICIEFVEQTINRIHAQDPRCLVIFDAAYEIRMPEKPLPGLACLSSDRSTHPEDQSPYARFLDTQGKPFDLVSVILTLPPHEFPPQDRPKATFKPFAQLEQEMALIICNGGRFQAWDQPAEVTDERISYLKRISRWLGERQPFCQQTVSLPDATILHSKAAHYKLTMQDDSCNVAQDPPLFDTAKSLGQNHINYEIIADWRLREGPVRSNLLVVEDAAALDDKTIEALGTYAHKGGQVLFTGKTITCSPAAAKLAGIALISDNPQKMDLAVELSTGTTCCVHADYYPIKIDRSKVLLKAELSEKEHGEYYPVLTANSSGNGMVYYCPLAVFSRKDSVIPDEIKTEILNIVLPKEQRQINVEGPATIEVSLRKKKAMYVVYLVNTAEGHQLGKHYSRVITDIPPAPNSRLSLKIPEKPISITREPGNRKAQWSAENGRIHINVPGFSISEMVVVHY